MWLINIMLWPLFRLADAVEATIVPLAQAIGKLAAYFAQVLHPTRAVLLLLLLYVFALTMTDQGRELVLSLPLDTSDGLTAFLIAWAIFILALFWASLQAWWWSRVLLNHAISAAIRDATSNNGQYQAKTRLQIDMNTVAGAPNPQQAIREQLEKDPRIEWTPRIYALALYVAAAVASAYPYDADSHWYAAGVMLGLGVLTFLFLTLRHKAAEHLPAWLGAILAPPLDLNPARTMAGRHVPSAFHQFTPSGMVMLALSFGVAGAMFLAVRWWAAETGTFFGALPLALMGLSSIIPVLAIFTLGEAMSRAPVMLVLVLVAFVFSLFPGLDHHQVRVYEKAPTVPAPKFADLAAAYTEWVKVNDPRRTGTPMILVYTAGGGIRAAYWTSALLSAMDKASPEFHKRVFAISGVSGGSVGAVFWTAALRNQSDPTCTMSGEATRSDVTPALGVDHLATTIGALLYADLFHAFAPLGRQDRASALEESWERAFAQTTGGDCLNVGFHTLWDKVGSDQWRPLLLINGTHQETGRRIITAPLPITADDFPDTLDFFDKFGREIRASTAALNSARFTYVSPAGRMTTKDGLEIGHILDGGYFENYGASTIRDLMVALDKIQLDQKQRRPVIVVEIVNDTDLTEEDAERNTNFVPITLSAEQSERRNEEALQALGPDWYGFGVTNEIIAPVRGLLATRGSRGILEAKLSARNFGRLWVDFPDNKDWLRRSPSLWQVSETANGKDSFQPVEGFEHVQLRLCPVNPKPPLGWVLGKASAKTMDNLVTKSGEQICKVHEKLNVILSAAGLKTVAQ